MIRVFGTAKERRSDKELIIAFRKDGDERALNTLFERYLTLVYGLCLKYLKHPAESQDAVMDIFETLPSKLLKIEVEHFKSWLYVISKNHCLMVLRKNTGIDLFLPQDMEIMDVPHLNEEREWKLDNVELCLRKLEGNQRRCMELFYLKENSYKEISNIIGLELKTVKSAIQNGKRNIKNCVENLTKKN